MGDANAGGKKMEVDLSQGHAKSEKKRPSTSSVEAVETPVAKRPKLEEEASGIGSGMYDVLQSGVSDVSEMTVEEAKQKKRGPNLFKDVKNNAATAEELMEERKKCQHQMCVPTGWQGDKWDDNAPTSAKPAKEYSFALDPFQKVSIACLERNESVLVSAHTSAGKTVVAQYAIAMSLRDKQRVVYTSPIKALSNQKYRDLAEEFTDVGLMTGDITINPEASCLVMTTEILRSMLYRGSEILREVGWVIFDEIHYMRDKERGVVWEETLILLPDKIRFVFLSATIPNAKEFADWIAHLHNQPCHVVYTDFRPVPLQHYVFPAGSTSLYLVLNERGQFLEDKFAEATARVAAPTDGIQSELRRKNASKMGQDTMHIVQVIMERNYEPVIVFAFSKKVCENLATKITAEYNSAEEAAMVSEIFNNAIDTLSEEDKLLPQVQSILPMLKRGVGIHHGGLLPLLKEVIELLFQEGLVKVLFATETFSIGLNMPAKTVVFTSVRKFDGGDFRWISGGEYIQMSGRAGRRGLDDRGVVIFMLDDNMPTDVAKSMIKGSADTLNSSFHIGYSMLLNTLRVEGLNPEHMLRSSFHQFQHVQHVPRIQGEIVNLVEKADEMKIENEAELADFHVMKTQLALFKKQVQEIVTLPEHILPFIIPGRLVHIVDGKTDWGWGVVLNYQYRNSAANNEKTSTPSSSSSKANDGKKDPTKYILDVMLYCAPLKQGEKRATTVPTPALHSDPKGEPLVIPVLLNLVSEISQLKLHMPKDLRSEENRKQVWKTLQDALGKFPEGPLLLDPVDDMEITSEAFGALVQKTQSSEVRFKSHPLYLAIERAPASDKAASSSSALVKSAAPATPAALYEAYCNKVVLLDKIRDLRRAIKTFEAVILKDDLKSKQRVLRRLGYTTKDNIIEMKGRVACEINAGDEIVITELIFSGYFNNLSPAQIAAMLSCFVYGEKGDDKTKLREELNGPFQTLQETARRVAEVELECKKEVNVDEYVASFKPTLAEVVYAWATGATFLSICGLTKVYEGSIIRAMRRLEELLRQCVAASKAIGNTELENKFAETIAAIKRDIVFAASLYL
jgi:ATP-dependent RNA helicase DOB1